MSMFISILYIKREKKSIIIVAKVQLNTLHKNFFHYLVYITDDGIKKSCFLTNIVFFNLKNAHQCDILIMD